jgi:Tfp pilus assembly protein PilN
MTPRRPWPETLAVVIVPVALLAASWSFLFSGVHGGSTNLKLVAPSDGAPGERLGMRAFFYTHLDEPGALVSGRAPVRVVLEDDRGAVLARTELAPSAVEGAEGHLDLPRSLVPGATLVLVATVTHGEGEIRVRAPMRIAREPAAVLEREREALELQTQKLYPLERVDRHWAGDVRVYVPRGGCIADSPCEITARVVGADPPLAGHHEVLVAPRLGLVRLSASVSTPPAPLADEGTLVARLEGPEAEVDVFVLHAGIEVARRRARLAVVPLGVPFRAANASALEGVDLLFPAAATAATNTGGREVLVDVFENGRWRDASSRAIPHGGGAVHVSFEMPRAGARQGAGSAAEATWRVQVRPGAHDSEDATSVLVTPVALTADELESAHAREGLVAELPEGVGSLAQANARAEVRVERARSFALVTFALGAVIAVIVVFLAWRRGATSRAAVARATHPDDPSPEPAERRLFSLLSAVLVLLLLLVVFAGAAAALLLRGHF